MGGVEWGFVVVVVENLESVVVEEVLVGGV